MPIPADSLAGGPGAELTGRRAECDTLDRLVAAVRSGVSRALVVHGEPGVGKSALLEYLAGRARDLQVVRAAGVQSEMELAFAAVHQLCAPMLGHVMMLTMTRRKTVMIRRRVMNVIITCVGSAQSPRVPRSGRALLPPNSRRRLR